MASLKLSHIYKVYENGEIGDKSLFEIYFEEFTSGRTVLYPSSGDTVYYYQNAGKELTSDGEKYRVITSSEVLVVL